ncbi:MAG: flagellar hook-basal body complex protein [Alphaproteobacteria bacterium]|nr:flagellar hook-basal body complex protein [Alphaproteobacteria bacterium]
MSLYGALFSGVSGLTAQSSAMGAISDNITNVSTVGYKGTTTNFQTLVTKQTSSTFYSAGGVQSKPRQQTDVQGLLQSSTSQTDISLSGAGFFVVNEANTPGVSDPYYYTRAGSFIQDDQGYLKNAQGYYLQGWPTDGNGDVVLPADKTGVVNQNIISSDYMESINLNRVGGTAQATSTVAIGANLPANATSFDGTLSDITTQDGYQKTDVQFFDSLGNANNMSFEYLRTNVGNQWDVRIEPPAGTTVATIYNSASADAGTDVYMSSGQLEFTGSRPDDGTYVKINGITYEFDKSGNGTTIASAAQVSTVTVPATAALQEGHTYTVMIGGYSVSYTCDATPTETEVRDGLLNAINAHSTLSTKVTAAAATATTFTVTGDFAGQAFNVSVDGFAGNGDGTTLGTISVATTTAATGNVTIDTSGNSTLAEDVTSLVNKIRTIDTEFSTVAATNAFGLTGNEFHKVGTSKASSTTLLLTGGPNSRGDISVDVTGLTNSGTPITKQGSLQNKSFTVYGTDVYGETAQVDKVTFANVGNNDVFTLSMHGHTITYTAGAADTVATVTANMVSAINNSPLQNYVTAANVGGTYMTITSNYAGMGFTTTSTTTDGSGAATETVTVSTTTYNSTGAVAFDSDGIPSNFSAAAVEILGYTNGASDMKEKPAGTATSGLRVTLDFGDTGQANGLTQFGAEFTPTFITQNGSKFGTFAGVTIGADGLVTALFDNGETRKIFKIPVATFVNPNQLESKSGNVWSATQRSGDYTLRVADTGPAGQVVQGALEASTVDIGAEFTSMIVVQRAYSASTKIITTADQMLEELMRTK